VLDKLDGYGMQGFRASLKPNIAGSSRTQKSRRCRAAPLAWRQRRGLCLDSPVQARARPRSHSLGSVRANCMLRWTHGSPLDKMTIVTEVRSMRPQ
jgi:hypothetical protein